MKRIVAWAEAFVMSIGGPGLFFIAFLDSSFLSLPEINDILVVYMVTRNKERMVYYASTATLGSIAGCFLLYYLGLQGGEAVLAWQFRQGQIEWALGLYKRYGVLAVVVPAILPPPAPFKIFVLMAGVAEVSPLHFVLAVAAGRGFRYFTEGVLALRYGDQAMDLIRENGRTVSIVLAALVLVAGLVYLVWR